MMESQNNSLTLEQQYENNEKWTDLIAWYEQQYASTSQPHESLVWLQKMVYIWKEKLFDTKHAIETCERMLILDSESLEAIRMISFLYFEEQQFKESYDFTVKALQKENHKTYRAVLLEQLGILELQYNRNPQKAIAAFREVLSIFPKQSKTIQQLINAYQIANDWKGVLNALQLQLEIEESVFDKIEILFEIAQIWKDRLQSSTNALSTLEAIMELDPNYTKNPIMLELLFSLHEQSENYLAMVEAAYTRSTLCETKQDQAAWLLQAGKIWASKLHNAEQGLQMISKAYELDSSNPIIEDAYHYMLKKTGEGKN